MAEFISMRLAALAGIDAAPMRLAQAAGKDVLLIRRFNRRKVYSGCDGVALTLLVIDEMMARHASYQELAHCD